MPKDAATDRRRGPYAKGTRRQAEILEQATQAFAERGFIGTSLREIAAAVGMTQQGISHHFPSKESLLEAVLQRRDDVSLDHYRSAGMSVFDTLRAVVRDNAARPGLVRLSSTLAAEAISPDHPAHAFFEERFARARGVFTTLVRRGQETGEVRDDVPPEVLGSLLVSVYEGLQLQWLVQQSVDMAGVLEGVLRLLAPPEQLLARDRSSR